MARLDNLVLADDLRHTVRIGHFGGDSNSLARHRLLRAVFNLPNVRRMLPAKTEFSTPGVGKALRQLPPRSLSGPD